MLTLAGCGDDSSTGTDDSHTQAQQSEQDATTGHDQSESGSDDSSSDGAVTIEVDGAPSDATWSKPLCADVGSTIQISSDAGNGKLNIQWPKGGGNSLVVELTLPDQPALLTNFKPGEASESGDTYTFTGEVSDKPNAPTASHQVKIEVVCD